MGKEESSIEWLMPNILGLTLELSNNRISQRTCELKILELLEQAKEMEKQQSIGLIKQTVMFMAASHLDEDIANMSYEDVYKTYYNETFGK
jgi:hypothetical protein